MAVERRQLVLGERVGSGGSHVSLDVARRAHAWNDDGRRRVAEAEPERDLRDPVDLDVEVSRDRLHAVPDLALAVTGEVLVPEVAVGERRLGPDGAC